MAKLPHQSSVPPVDPQDGAIKSDGGAADSLQTTTSDVVVSTAAAPSAGDVLTAIDGVSADWQAPAAGGGASGVPLANSSLYFDGVGHGRVTDANSSDFDLPDDFTFESWIRHEVAVSWGFVTKAAATYGNYSIYGTAGGSIYVDFFAGSNQSKAFTGYTNNVGKWQHVAITRNRSTGVLAFYLNGVFNESAVLSTAAATNSTADFELGLDNSGTREMHGTFSDVRVWSTARTADEIFQSYQRGLNGDESGLVAYYRGDSLLDAGPGGGGNNTLDQISSYPTIVTSTPGAVVAHGLETSTGSVSIDTAGAPVAGEALVATGPGSAGWELVAGPIYNGIAFNEESADFDKSSSQSATIADPNLFQGLAAMTIECWVNPDDLANGIQGIVGQALGFNEMFWLAIISATQVQVMISTNSSQSTYNVNHGMANGTWAHVAFTWDGPTGNTKVYINGVQVGITTALQSGTIYNANGAEFQVGGIRTGDMDGKLSECRIWSVVKSIEEINHNMNRAMSGAEENLLTLHHLDGDFRDVGPFSKNLTAQNGPVFVADVPFSVGAGEVAASDPIASAQGDYIDVYNSITQTDPAVSEVIVLDDVFSQRGELSNSNGVISGLKAGRTYLLIGAPRAVHTAEFQMSFQFWDLTADANIGGWYDTSATYTGIHANTISPGTVFFNPSVDSSVALRIASKSADADIRTGTSVRVIEIGAVQADVIGGLEFMDIIDVTADQTSVLFGAAGDGAFKRALDGDVDNEYVLSYHLPDTAAAITLRPNSIDPAVDTTFDSSTSLGGQSAVNVEQDTWQINGQSAGYVEAGDLQVQAKTGRIRSFIGHTSVIDASVAGRFVSTMGGQWENTAINFTSLQIFSSIADGIKIGARFVLWRRTTSNVRADSASVYERNVEAIVAQGTAATVTYTTGAAVFGGSAVGVSVSLVDDTVASGSVTVDLKVNGSIVLTAILDSTNTSMHRASSQVGAIPIIAGQEIEVDVTTTSLSTTGSPASPAISVNLMLISDAFVQPPVGSAYLIAALTSDQTTNIALGNHIEFDATSSRGTDIVMSTGAGQLTGLFTLQPGKTYEIHANLRCTTNEGSNRSRWVLHPSDAALVDDTGVLAALHVHVDNTGDLNQQNSSVHVFTPSVETVIKIDRITPNANFVQWDSGSRVFIKELL